RGEHVIVVAPAPEPAPAGAAELTGAVRRLREAGVESRQVQRVLQALYGASRAEAYAAARAPAPPEGSAGVAPRPGAGAGGICG
ncbi:MAG TPA: hypothetical protein VMD59_14175, partial [Acidimicrobiales bacterium]|nr:hypothetical protein [Acidimicrobiales bacterium]